VRNGANGLGSPWRKAALQGCSLRFCDVTAGRESLRALTLSLPLVLISPMWKQERKEEGEKENL